MSGKWDGRTLRGWRGPWKWASRGTGEADGWWWLWAESWGGGGGEVEDGEGRVATAPRPLHPAPTPHSLLLCLLHLLQPIKDPDFIKIPALFSQLGEFCALCANRVVEVSSMWRENRRGCQNREIITWVGRRKRARKFTGWRRGRFRRGWCSISGHPALNPSRASPRTRRTHDTAPIPPLSPRKHSSFWFWGRKTGFIWEIERDFWRKSAPSLIKTNQGLNKPNPDPGNALDHYQNNWVPQINFQNQGHYAFHIWKNDFLARNSRRFSLKIILGSQTSFFSFWRFPALLFR